MAFTKDRGDSLAIRVENQHRGGLCGVSEYRLSWDERLGYVWDCESRYTMPQPARIEFEFQPSPHDPFLVLRLCVDGTGSAWFDDVLLETLC